MNYWFAQARLFAGGLAVAVGIAVIVGAFGFGMYQFSGESVGEPAYGPGRIAFVSDRDGDDEIYLMNADGSGLVQLTENDSADYSPAWSPDGGRLVFTSERDNVNDAEIYDIYVMNADGSRVEQLTDGCSKGQLAWSPDGDRIAFTSLADIYVMNADGSDVEQLTGKVSASCAVVFFSDRDGDGYREAHIMNADGSVELFTDYDSLNWNTVDGGPSWSPDGGRIAFQSHRDGDMEIYVMNADGSGVVQLTENDLAIDWLPSWSPDGGRIAFESNRDGDDEIYVMNADGSGVERLTDNEYDDRHPAWSPDGGRIAFVSDREGDHGIYVMNADGSGVVRLAEGYSPSWSPLLD